MSYLKLNKGAWLNLALINLCIVAFLGFTLRSKILFSLPFIDYRKVLSAHSHFAFGGWAGLALITLLIFELLPPEIHTRKKYGIILWGLELSSLGMAFSFPFQGYGIVSLSSSSLYIFVSFYFAWVFIGDLVKVSIEKSIKLLSISGVVALVISSIGPLGLAYILISHSGNSLLYRDSIYTFLHFQYNGFFSLSVLSLFINYVSKRGFALSPATRTFSVCMSASIIPSLFLSLLWHNNILFYILAIIGCVLILSSLFYFFKTLKAMNMEVVFPDGLCRMLLTFSFVSFGLKMLLHIGTVIPALGNAIYGDRPVIIGFLHLVFLGFVTFYILSSLIRDQPAASEGKIIRYPFIFFTIGILANELLLMLQGLGILFRTNSNIYEWLLWFAAIILLTGAMLIALSRTLKQQV